MISAVPGHLELQERAELFVVKFPEDGALRAGITNDRYLHILLVLVPPVELFFAIVLPLASRIAISKDSAWVIRMPVPVDGTHSVARRLREPLEQLVHHFLLGRHLGLFVHLEHISALASDSRSLQVALPRVLLFDMLQ